MKPDGGCTTTARLPPSRAFPFEAAVLWQDDHLLVVDKPHFLPVMPSGKYLQETVLIRLKNTLGLDALSPIHRIDRDTAGLVLFSKQVSQPRGLPGAVPHAPGGQDLRMHRAVESGPDMAGHTAQSHRAILPLHATNRGDGMPNALTHITPVEVQGLWRATR